MQTAADKISLRVSVARQTAEVRAASGAVLRTFPVSTSAYGLGSEPGSFRTPLGHFRVAEKIGGGAPLGTIFRSRVSTGESGLNDTGDDLILTRILWLDGVEPHNRNTRDRYIYIHGTNHEAAVGQPVSHGCIRLRNADVMELFDLVETGTAVSICAT